MTRSWNHVGAFLALSCAVSVSPAAQAADLSDEAKGFGTAVAEGVTSWDQPFQCGGYRSTLAEVEPDFSLQLDFEVLLDEELPETPAPGSAPGTAVEQRSRKGAGDGIFVMEDINGNLLYVLVAQMGGAVGGSLAGAAVGAVGGGLVGAGAGGAAGAAVGVWGGQIVGSMAGAVVGFKTGEAVGAAHYKIVKELRERGINADLLNELRKVLPSLPVEGSKDAFLYFATFEQRDLYQKRLRENPQGTKLVPTCEYSYIREVLPEVEATRKRGTAELDGQFSGASESAEAKRVLSRMDETGKRARELCARKQFESEEMAQALMKFNLDILMAQLRETCALRVLVEAGLGPSSVTISQTVVTPAIQAGGPEIGGSEDGKGPRSSGPGGTGGEGSTAATATGLGGGRGADPAPALNPPSDLNALNPNPGAPQGSGRKSGGGGGLGAGAGTAPSAEPVGEGDRAAASGSNYSGGGGSGGGQAADGGVVFGGFAPEVPHSEIIDYGAPFKDLPASMAADPVDYFGRIPAHANLFQVVARRYRAVDRYWESNPPLYPRGFSRFRQ
ncbi:MAG: hypothetical protein IT285_13475 [Bdellovibrionales bacterium]|nr:hypothetical protein [Bdellovibrionales bacterium]